MKQSEVKGLSVEELQEKLVSYKAQLEDMKRSHFVTPLENPMEIRQVRRTVARLATELTNRENQ